MIFITNDLFHLSSLLRSPRSIGFALPRILLQFYHNSQDAVQHSVNCGRIAIECVEAQNRFVQNPPGRTQRAPPKRSPHTGWQRLHRPTKSLPAFSYGHPHFLLIMGRAHWNSCTSSIAEKSQKEKRIFGLLCAKKTKLRPLRRPRRFRGRCHCSSGNAAGISLQTDSAWPCAGVPHFLRWAP